MAGVRKSSAVGEMRELTVENYVASRPVYGEGLCAERLDGSKGVGILANDETRQRVSTGRT